MATIEQFLAHWCSPDLTEVQRIVTDAMIRQGRVIGVARPVGGVDYFPLVSFGRMQPNVIDRAGYYQLAASTGIRLFEPGHQCVPWRGRGGDIGACVRCGAQPANATDQKLDGEHQAGYRIDHETQLATRP